MDITQIFKNNKRWIQEKLNSDSDYFNNLSKGQNPDILYIGCSDSRVTAEELMGVSLGEVFVYRNIANMVPNTDLGVMTAIDYAVLHLKVNHIVVCGHYYCGGVASAMRPEDLGILNPWLRNIRDVYRIHRDELNRIKDEEQRYKRLVELNVQEQCVNVSKVAEVQQAFRERGITIHGWVFDIHTGKLIDLKINTAKMFDDVMEIYRLG